MCPSGCMRLIDSRQSARSWRSHAMHDLPDRLQVIGWDQACLREHPPGSYSREECLSCRCLSQPTSFTNPATPCPFGTMTLGCCGVHIPMFLRQQTQSMINNKSLVKFEQCLSSQPWLKRHMEGGIWRNKLRGEWDAPRAVNSRPVFRRHFISRGPISVTFLSSSCA